MIGAQRLDLRIRDHVELLNLAKHIRQRLAFSGVKGLQLALAFLDYVWNTRTPRFSKMIDNVADRPAIPRYYQGIHRLRPSGLVGGTSDQRQTGPQRLEH